MAVFLLVLVIICPWICWFQCLPRQHAACDVFVIDLLHMRVSSGHDQFTLESDIGHIKKHNVNSQTKKSDRSSEWSTKACGVNVVLNWTLQPTRFKMCKFYSEDELSLFPALDFLFNFHCTSWILKQANASAHWITLAQGGQWQLANACFLLHWTL